MEKLLKQELVKLVRKIKSGKCTTEYELEDIIDQIHQNIPGPDIIGLVFHHKPELTAEEIVEKALAYKPIILGLSDEASTKDTE